MAARKKKTSRKSKKVDLIISKARTKNAVKKCNVGGDFYGALDEVVRELIKGRKRSIRRTLRGDRHSGSSCASRPNRRRATH